MNEEAVPSEQMMPRSNGTKIVLYPSAANTGPEFAIGIESGFMWLNTAAAANGYKLYLGSIQRYLFDNNNLTLPAAPTANMHAATKQYVDSVVSTGNFVGKTGAQTMAGPLTITGGQLVLQGNAANAFVIASDSQKYFDFRRGNNTTMRWRLTSYNSNDDRFELRANTNAGTFDVVEYYDRQTWNGWTYGNWSCGSLTQRSDISLKTSIETINLNDISYAFNSLNPVRYHLKEDSTGRPVDTETLRWGFIADEIEQGAPDVIIVDSDGIKGYDIAQVLAIAVAEIKRLGSELAQLKAEVAQR
jgi:Chaperone of endosialidase